MVLSERMNEEAYRRLAREQPDRQWELHHGRAREKPGMSAEHNDLMFQLGYRLQLRLDPAAFRVRVNAGRLRRPATTSYIPDVAVLPADVERAERRGPGHLETYDAPLPLVVEVWSPSTGDYDVTEKLAEYQARGDGEIWLLHPYERTLTAWRRQPDGTYQDAIFRGGLVRPVFLPDVAIDLDALFAATA